MNRPNLTVPATPLPPAMGRTPREMRREAKANGAPVTARTVQARATAIADR
jgi:hypothetical protein